MPPLPSLARTRYRPMRYSPPWRGFDAALAAGVTVSLPLSDATSLVPLHEKDGDVVFAAVRVGFGDQGFRGFLRVGVRLDQALEIRVDDHAGKAVGAHEQGVAHRHLVRGDVDV